jgi:hypothetical protein
MPLLALSSELAVQLQLQLPSAFILWFLIHIDSSSASIGWVLVPVIPIIPIIPIIPSSSSPDMVPPKSIPVRPLRLLGHDKTIRR